MRKVDDGEKKRRRKEENNVVFSGHYVIATTGTPHALAKKRKEKRMSFLVATNIVASW